MKRIFTTLAQKWPEYTLEILVITISIWGAFALNNWGDKNARKKEELEILKGCKAELTKDLLEIQFNMSELNQSLRSLDIILTAFEQNLPYHDSLASYFNYTLLPMHFVHSTSTFETLKSKGLDIISNDSVRSQLINLYDSQYEFFIQGETEELEHIHYNLRHLIPDRFESSWNFQGDSFQGEMIPIDFEALKKDTKYLYFIKTQRNRTNSYIEFFYTNLNNSVKSMIHALNQELNRIDR
ncbi:hypothetical protein [Ekhidna sp.]|uniref:hypothetical protein n=1 Tax=Ekhidna sp. TaxID=2608089 RepID=UPI0032F0849F